MNNTNLPAIHWKEIIYLAICTILTSFYLSVTVFACQNGMNQIACELKIQEFMTKTEEKESESVKTKPYGGDFMLKLAKTEEPKTQKREPYQWNDWSDVRKPSGITVEELHNAMYYDENNYAPFYIEAEKKYGINAIFLYAIAQNESQNGRSKVAILCKNLFGWTYYDENLGYQVYFSFDSVETCIDYVARALSEHYLNDQGQCFEGYSIEAVNVHYNGTPHWAELTREIADMVQNEVIASQQAQGLI